jgi:hypothetical protein
MKKEKLKVRRQAAAEGAETYYEEMIEAYLSTGNPLYAWEALFEWVLPENEPERFPLPQELLTFLFEMSKGIIGLSLGLSVPIKPREYRDGREIERPATKQLTPGDACDFLPEALRLRGYKWNAFNEYARSEKAINLSFAYRFARECGATELEALHTLSKLSGVNDERTLHRKMKGGRGPRQKTPYPLPTRAPAKSGEASRPIKKTPKGRGAKKA